MQANLTPTKPKFKLSRADLLTGSLVASAALYLSITEPVGFTIFACASLVCFCCWQIMKWVPGLERAIGTRIQFWHVATAIVTATLIATVVQPADAIFLSALETFFKDIATQSSSGAGGTSIDPATITLIFNIIRGIFLLLVATASLFAYNQAQQGNDWRPIITQIGLAFGIVIAIDVITFLFIGDGQGTTTP